MIKKQEFKHGKVTYNTLDKFNFNINLSKQYLLLEEDLLQINYPKNIVLDVGWYPALDINGSFMIVIIKDYNWENPIKSKSCKNLDELELTIKEFHNYIVNNLLNK